MIGGGAHCLAREIVVVVISARTSVIIKGQLLSGTLNKWPLGGGRLWQLTRLAKWFQFSVAHFVKAVRRYMYVPCKRYHRTEKANNAFLIKQKASVPSVFLDDINAPTWPPPPSTVAVELLANSSTRIASLDESLYFYLRLRNLYIYLVRRLHSKDWDKFRKKSKKHYMLKQFWKHERVTHRAL